MAESLSSYQPELGPFNFRLCLMLFVLLGWGETKTTKFIASLLYRTVKCQVLAGNCFRYERARSIIGRENGPPV